MGHPGQWKTIELISREYWWPGITEFVKAYIKGCASCQTTKIRPPVQVPLKPNEILQGIWETITINFITDLPTSQGYDSILTVVDRHSKAVSHSLPLPQDNHSRTNEPVAHRQHLEENWGSHSHYIRSRTTICSTSNTGVLEKTQDQTEIIYSLPPAN